MRIALFCIIFILSGCFEKDNKAREPVSSSDKIKRKYDLYLAGVQKHLDPDGMVLMGHSIGDSALFSCLARVAGATDFNPEDLLTPEGKPVRHPIIHRDRDEWLQNHCHVGEPRPNKSNCTPISKDMVSGVLWCIWDLAQTEPQRAQDMGLKMLAYGRSNKKNLLWNFCSEQDIEEMKIIDKDIYGRCLMTPQVSKDLLRILISTGWECDAKCKVTLQVGVNVPLPRSGYSRHLGVIGTLRNGMTEGAINDLSLAYLKDSAEAVPRNALYQAAYHTFLDGDQTKAYEALLDESLFPSDRIPSFGDYCSDYLFQRDEKKDQEYVADDDGCINFLDTETVREITECGLDKGETVNRYSYNKDWLPCEGSGAGHGIEWLFAARVALGLGGK